MKVAELVLEKISPLFSGDIKLIDVEYVKKTDGMHLVVYIDKANGVDIDDCVAVNDLINPVLDELNPTGEESYSLDVSSYGLDKPLKYDWQFEKYYNQKVEVKLYHKVDDLKEFVAVLIARDNTSTQFELDNKKVTLANTDIAYVTPYIEF